MESRIICGIVEIIGCSILTGMFGYTLYVGIGMLTTSTRSAEPIADGRRLAMIIGAFLWFNWSVIRWIAAYQFYILATENHYINCVYPIIRLVLLIGGVWIGIHYALYYSKFMWLQPVEQWIQKIFKRK